MVEGGKGAKRRERNKRDIANLKIFGELWEHVPLSFCVNL
jgi:hypothetical protein